MNFTWNQLKNAKLKLERKVSFEEIVIAIQNDCIVDIIEHPNSIKYPNQKLYIIKFNKYIYIVPVEISQDEIELKTIFRSRKFNKIYNKGD
jgi:hypothetical protein